MRKFSNFFSPELPTKELIHSKNNKIIPPFMISNTEILRSPTLNASKLSKSIVVFNNPKLCNAANTKGHDRN